MLSRDVLFHTVKAAYEAGQIIMTYFKNDFATTLKPDQSFVTEADKAAHVSIEKALKDIFPAIPIISEEGDLPSAHTLGSTFWLVDPLDGTNQFIRGQEEFTVNIAFIQNHTPVLGVIYHPPSKAMYAALYGSLYIGTDLDIQEVQIPPSPARKMIIGSVLEKKESSFNDLLTQENLTPFDIKILPSSLKFCSMAMGNAYIQYRSRPSSEWDIAAGHALIAAFGGKILTFSGEDLIYGKEDFKNPGFIVRLPFANT